MNAHDPKMIELRAAADESAQAGMGRYFRDDQGETFHPHNPNHRSQSAILGVLALDNGRWLARTMGFKVDGPQYPTHDAALRASIAPGIKRWRNFERAEYGEKWPTGAAGRVIEWALSIAPAKNITGGGEPSQQTASHPRGESDPVREAGFGDGSPAPVVDPVIAELIARKKSRKSFHSDHLVTMTRALEGDLVVCIGTCKCGATFKFAPSRYLAMDAAIELHWQKFDPENVAVTGITATSEPACDVRIPRPPSPPDQHAGSPVNDDWIIDDAAAKIDYSGDSGAASQQTAKSLEPACDLPQALPGPGEAHAGSPSNDDWMIELAKELAWRDEARDADAVTLRLADSDRTLLDAPIVDLADDRQFIGIKVPRKYLRFACRELSKIFKKLDATIEQKLAEEPADLPALFDLSKFDDANTPPSLEIEGVE